MSRLWLCILLLGTNLMVAGCSATSQPPPPMRSVNSERRAALARANRELGVDYRYGAQGPNAFDCSGLMQYIYARIGVNLPRTTAGQWHAGPHVAFKHARPGDLLFYRFSSNWSGLHVGIYTGRGHMIHASTSADQVTAIDITTRYWRRRFLSAVRILPPDHS